MDTDMDILSVGLLYAVETVLRQNNPRLPAADSGSPPRSAIAHVIRMVSHL